MNISFLRFFTCALLTAGLAHPAWPQSKAIQATRANALHGTNRDGVPYPDQNSYTGKGMILNNIEGNISVSQPELTGRVKNYGASPSGLEHPTEVASVAVATGVVPAVKGTAFEAMVRAYDWSNRSSIFDLESLFLQDKQPLDQLISNHSYEFPEEFNRALTYGTYDLAASDVDSLMSKYPYWLPIVASGNSGQDGNPAPNTTNPVAGLNYDRLKAGFQTAKNTLVVGGISTFSIATDGTLVLAKVSREASLGPTDDLRVKPEVVAPNEGIDVATINKGYALVNGTSYAAPAVAGAGLLLQQYYNAKFKRYMRAATLKALLIHSAERITAPSGYIRTDEYGPDPFGGYGLINVRAGAQAIRNTWLSQNLTPTSIIYESTLKQNRDKSIDIPTKAGQPVRVSLCWLDPKHNSEIKLNSVNTMLLNDLEVRVLETSSNGSNATYYPYSFYKAYDGNIYSRATQGNSVDPYEFIRFVPKPKCNYRIYIYHRGDLRYGNQPYSLVVTGLGTDEDPTCEATTAIKQPITATVAITAPKAVVVQRGGLLNGQVLLSTAPCATNTASAREAYLQDFISKEVPEPLTIYPNPTPKECLISHSLGIRRITVLTETGKVVATYNCSDVTEQRVDLSGFAVGIYLLRIESATGIISTKKVIKQP